jgi:hypothetical protein
LGDFIFHLIWKFINDNLDLMLKLIICEEIMKTLVLIISSFTISLSAISAEVYIIEKVNKGTHFLKPDQKFAGYVDNNEVCGAMGGNMAGSEACAVVTPLSKEPEQQTYYLEETFVTGTPASNLVGFIQGSIKKAPGIGGDKGIGVFKMLAPESAEAN